MARTIPLERFRNIGILANRDAGRTTTTERLLAAARGAGDETRLEQDNERDITLTSAATGCIWRDCRINVVELSVVAPSDLAGSLAVLDGAVLLLDGTDGLGGAVGSVLDATEKSGVPRLVFVNKLDEAGAALDSLIAGLKARGTADPVLVQLPLDGFDGMVDLLEMRATLWKGAVAESVEIPAEAMVDAQAARKRLLVGLGVAYDASADAVRQALRKAVIAGRVMPVLCGSAFRNRGVVELLDAIVAYLPAPSEVTVRRGLAADGGRVERRAADDEPFSGVVFRTVEDMTFVRIFSGVVATGSQMLNSVTTSPERIGRMIRMHANHTEEIEEARAGDIVALAGLKNTTIGDTLCDPAAPVILEPVPASAGRVK